MMDNFEFDNRIKSTPSNPISTVYSQIAWQGVKVVSVLLIVPTINKDVHNILIRYVLSDYRRTWVNALLMHSCVMCGESSDAEYVQFEANSKSHYKPLYPEKKRTVNVLQFLTDLKNLFNRRTFYEH